MPEAAADLGAEEVALGDGADQALVDHLRDAPVTINAAGVELDVHDLLLRVVPDALDIGRPDDRDAREIGCAVSGHLDIFASSSSMTLSHSSRQAS